MPVGIQLLQRASCIGERNDTPNFEKCVAPILEIVQVSGSRCSDNGSLILRCDSHSSAETATDCVRADMYYVLVRLPSHRPIRPKIITDIPKDLSQENLLSSRRLKNSMLADLSPSYLQLLFIPKPQNSTVHAVLAVSHSLSLRCYNQFDGVNNARR